MTILGFVSEEECQGWRGGTPYLPSFSFYEKHESAPFNAPAVDIIRAVKEIDMLEDPVIARLHAIRQFPERLVETLFSQSKPEKESFGFHTFIPLYEDSHEISKGLAGRFWRLDMGIIQGLDDKTFIALNDSQAAKLVLRFLVIEHPNGLRSLRTETFIYCPNSRIKRWFACYWGAIRPASGWIRMRMLDTIRHKLIST